MGRERVKIVNTASADLVVEDLNLRLPRGGHGFARRDAAERSARSGCLRDLRGMWRFEAVRDPVMPIWPFIKERPPPPAPRTSAPPASPVTPEALAEALASIRGIEGALRETLAELKSRPMAPPADVLAAHVHAISQRGGIPLNLPGGDDPADAPMFLPSKIVPDAQADIKLEEEQVEKGDLDDGVAALKRLRGKK